MTDWARKTAGGGARALARAARGIENRDPRALEVLRELRPRAGHAVVVGITGPPGAGKSTLVDAMARELRRQGRTAGIIAVDPTSRRTGGAILGDRIRMLDHHADPGIFIRSMATRGTSGGLAQATGDMATLLDAAGKDFVIIETVGVGQYEVEIAGVAQVTVVVLVPGMGDDIQAIKAGIMEIADVFVINKSDQPGAERMEREIQSALSLAQNGPKPPIIRTIATNGTGIPELLKAVRSPPRLPAHSLPRRSQLAIADRHHRRQWSLLHAGLRSAGRGGRGDAVWRAFRQPRGRQAGGPQRRVSGAARTWASHFAVRAELPREHICDEVAGRGAHHFAQRGGIAEGGAQAARLRHPRSVRGPHPRAHLYVLRRRVGGAYRLLRSHLPAACRGGVPGVRGGRSRCHQRWFLFVHGRSGVLHARRVEPVPKLGHGRHRHDQPARGQASDLRPESLPPKVVPICAWKVRRSPRAPSRTCTEAGAWTSSA